VAAAFKNSSAEAYNSVEKPLEVSKRCSAVRTAASSSVTAITFCSFTVCLCTKSCSRSSLRACRYGSVLQGDSANVFAGGRQETVYLGQGELGSQIQAGTCELGSSVKVISELTSATGFIARLAYRSLLEARIDPQTLLTKAGLTHTDIQDARIRLKVQKQISFLNLAAGALEDDFLGFHLAERCELREIGLLYYVLASSENLPDALQRAVRYSSIVNDGVSLKCIGSLPVGLSLIIPV
jgi:hypothetical protein